MDYNSTLKKIKNESNDKGLFDFSKDCGIYLNDALILEHEGYIHIFVEQGFNRQFKITPNGEEFIYRRRNMVAKATFIIGLLSFLAGVILTIISIAHCK